MSYAIAGGGTAVESSAPELWRLFVSANAGCAKNQLSNRSNPDVAFAENGLDGEATASSKEVSVSLQNGSKHIQKPSNQLNDSSISRIF